MDPPEADELATVAAGAPPMQGAEYLSAEVLSTLWAGLDAWVREQVSVSGKGLSEWLRKHAPGWHQVGRVCFHLAENKRDADYPFAFLATYAPRLSRAGRVQYQPLSRALQEYAGASDKPALVRLLSPVHAASQRSDLVHRLVDSGEVFQPLAWTPAEAYELLSDEPVLEECGLLVRLPDWWAHSCAPARVGECGGHEAERLWRRGHARLRRRPGSGRRALDEGGVAAADGRRGPAWCS